MLQIVDSQWKDHLYSLDHLKEGIGLRGYGQKDPLVEYKKESFALFTAMKDRIEEEIVRYLWRLTPVIGEEGAEPAGAGPPAGASPSAAAHAQRTVDGRRGVAVRRHRRKPWSGECGRRAAGPAASRAHRRRRHHPAGQARRAEGRTERSLSVRQRQEIQEVPRGLNVQRATCNVLQATVPRQESQGQQRRLLPFCF